MDSNNIELSPGLDTGYIYQRRWVPYFVTPGIATSWVVLGAVLNGNRESTKTGQLIWIGGLFLISITTMIESKIAHKKAIRANKEKHQAKTHKRKRPIGII